MAGYQAGDREAFERLHEELSRVLKRYLHSIVRDAGGVDDLVQDTFLQIHRARHTYDPSFPVTPWALAIARHVFLMDRRSRNRRREFARQPLEDTPEPSVASHEEPLIARSGIRHALGTLSHATREAVLLHHVCGLSFSDISRRLRVGSPALRCRASRGIARLREVLTSDISPSGE
jgi:RNA polymerase sigma-70 factor (ECF subfamily)